jgi:outer membrane lipoprotein SlyB
VGSLLFPGIGTLLGILVGAAGGAVAGNTVGKLVDENVIRRWECQDCGYTWRM